MLRELEERVIAGGELTVQEVLEVLELGTNETLELLAAANRIRQHFQGDKVDLCSIINVKSGKCSEDCAFCAQSVHHGVEIQTYELLDPDAVLVRAKLMEKVGAHRFALVSSGKGVNGGKEFEKILEIIAALKKETSLALCASLGLLTFDAATRLREAGLQRYHHNIETAESFFPQICSTHTYRERIATIKIAQEAGLSICSGVLIGLGENREQRMEMAYAIKELNVASVPFNVLNPIKGTPLGERVLLDPWEILKSLAAFRMIMPKTNLRLCGGREINLRDLQALGMLAGVNGLMIGNYLTTSGKEPIDDLKMLKDLGFSY